MRAVKGVMPDGTTPKLSRSTNLSLKRLVNILSLLTYRLQNQNTNEQVCSLGCGVTTGRCGKNTAKVQEGDSVAVFGLGGIGYLL